MTNSRFDALFDGPPRQAETKLGQREMDLARSVQEVTEEVMLRLARTLHRETGSDNLCLAGGWRSTAWATAASSARARSRLWISRPPVTPAERSGRPCWPTIASRTGAQDQPADDAMKGGYLGPKFSNEEIEGFLEAQDAPYERLSDADILTRVAEEMAAGKVIGWFQGAWSSARALGGRSIIATPAAPRCSRS